MLAGELVSAQTAARDSAEPQMTKAKAATPAAKTSRLPSRMRRRINTLTSLRAAKAIRWRWPRLGPSVADPGRSTCAPDVLSHPDWMHNLKAKISSFFGTTRSPKKRAYQVGKAGLPGMYRHG